MTSDRREPQFDWFIPIDGDGARIGTVRADREPTFEYLRQVVETAEREGFHSLLIPTRFSNGLFDEAAPLAETWTTATALAAVTERIRFLVAVRPGFIPAGLFAQMAATFDRMSHGRLDINIVPGGIQGDMERLGVTSSHDRRYEQAEEFMTACRTLWARPGERVDFEGGTTTLRNAIVSPGPSAPGPSWYLGGASPSALALAASQGDTLLMWIQPLEDTRALMERARVAASEVGRELRFGLRTHLVVADDEDEAWRLADALIADASETVIAQRHWAVEGTSMVGAAAQARDFKEHRVTDRLWNGISLVRVNLGTAIVGTPRQVADELFRYWELGIDEFILSGFPHVEECEHVARDVLPLMRERIAAS
ncbi:MAG: LLM class flavin-dependent oxidoreductase [Chloroflexi bacterium]|nr:LLM class flavin-dependent oxidoreductase [Chloroflexota bacterium]MDA1146276.1 LLM class flavin-dependent oxidoreductase [Chloroflexota bacterium]